MGMRITTKMIYNMAINNIRNNLTRLTKSQNRLATQKNIQTISDDPIGAGRIMDYATKLNQIGQFERNINRAENRASIYDTTLQQVIGNMLRVKEIAVAAANDVGLNTTQREAYASELQQI